MTEFKLHIDATNKEFYNGECISLIVPTPTGMYGVQAGHCNEIMAIEEGMITIRKNETETILAHCSDGMIKIDGKEVLVLVDSIELPEEIEINRAKRALEEEEELRIQKQSRAQFLSAEKDIAEALDPKKNKTS